MTAKWPFSTYPYERPFNSQIRGVNVNTDRKKAILLSFPVIDGDADRYAVGVRGRKRRISPV
jgi:hypothetical protein